MPRPSKYGININTAGIYMIKNLINNKVYIGSAKNLCNRLSSHKHHLNNNKHHSIHLQSAWKKYGEDVFIFGVIEVIDDITKLIDAEQYFINKYKSYDDKYGYNICPLAKNNLGSKHQKGIESKKKRMMGCGNNFYGKKHTPEALFEISKNNPRKKLTSENINEIKFLNDYGVNQDIIAKMFNVGQPYISKIINNKRRIKNYKSCQDQKDVN